MLCKVTLAQAEHGYHRVVRPPLIQQQDGAVVPRVHTSSLPPGRARSVAGTWWRLGRPRGHRMTATHELQGTRIQPSHNVSCPVN